MILQREGREGGEEGEGVATPTIPFSQPRSRMVILAKRGDDLARREACARGLPGVA